MMLEFLSNQTLSAPSFCESSEFRATPNVSAANLSSSALAPLSLQGLQRGQKPKFSFLKGIALVLLQ